MRFLLTLGFLLLLNACESHDAAGVAATQSIRLSSTPTDRTASSAASATAAVAGAGANDTTLRAACDSTCDASAPIHCGTRSQCIEGCRQNLSLATCEPAMLVFLRCAAHQSKEKWGCSDGVPSLKDGICDAEQSRVAACLGVK